MRFFTLVFVSTLGSMSLGFELNCTAQYRGPTESKPYEVVQQKLNLQFDSQDYQTQDTVLFGRYFAATYDKTDETVFLQIINNSDSTQGQTSKSFLPVGKKTGLHLVHTDIVYSLFCDLK